MLDLVYARTTTARMGFLGQEQMDSQPRILD
jgi:hypothetical protein